MKIRPVGAEFFHVHRETGGQSDGHDEAHIPPTQFCERT